MPKNNEVNANNEVKFKIIEVKEITAKNGNKFTAYKTVGKGGKKLDVRFTKACKNVPTSTCTIVVKKENANVDTSRIYPILWVKNVERIEENERRNNIDEFFGEEADEV
jgi:hypothetical protein